MGLSVGVKCAARVGMSHTCAGDLGVQIYEICVKF
jgi:hypothetical protein